MFKKIFFKKEFQKIKNLEIQVGELLDVILSQKAELEKLDKLNALLTGEISYIRADNVKLKNDNIKLMKNNQILFDMKAINRKEQVSSADNKTITSALLYL